jgi:hypothetical protein
MHQALQSAVFHVEHIIPRKLGGSDDLNNLAWACPGCNLTKSDRVTIADPVTGQMVPMFHPRQDEWAEHFAWEGFELVGALQSAARWYKLSISITSGAFACTKLKPVLVSSRLDSHVLARSY